MARQAPTLCIIVLGHAGGATIGLLGRKLVVIPPEDPTWGTIIAKAQAAAAVARAEGMNSAMAIKLAGEASKLASAKAVELAH